MRLLWVKRQKISRKKKTRVGVGMEGGGGVWGGFIGKVEWRSTSQTKTKKNPHDYY